MSESTRITLSAGQLSSIDDSTLCNAFHSSVWSRLTDESKLNLCQEVENRQAAADGVAPRTISAESLQGSFYGYQQGNRIVINSNMLYDGVFRADVRDEQGNLLYTTEKPVEAVGWNTLDTIIHEHTHGVREDMGLSSYVYIDSKTDGALYRIQDEEKAAYAAGQQFALTALQNAEHALGLDSERNGYIEAVKAESYQAALEQAKLEFNDPFIDKTLQQFISDYENGIVNENPSPAYSRISALYNEQLYQHFQQLQAEALAEAQVAQNSANNTAAQTQQTTTQIAENNPGQTQVTNQILTTPASNTNTAEPENSTNNTTTVSDNSLDNDDGGTYTSQKSSGSSIGNDDGGTLASFTSAITFTDNGITNDDGGSLSSHSLSGGSIENDDGGSLSSLSSSDNGITNDDGGSLSSGYSGSSEHGGMDDGGSSIGSNDNGADNSSSGGNDNGSDNSMD